jgi:hypothetical protein
MTGRANAADILEQLQCSVAGCLCAISLRKLRGPIHRPSCSEQPNLALRVRGEAVYCKAGCDEQ